MSSGTDEAEKRLKEMEKEITCSICHEHYTHPKVLPCLHYYCKHCILKLALRKGKDKPFACPECRKEATLPEGNEDNLQTAFFVNRFRELYDKWERALGKEEIKCEICTTSQVKAEAFCRQCNKFICEKCVESHLRMKAIFENHEVLSLDAFKVRAQDIISKNPTVKCQPHRKSLKMFCFDCNQLICRYCTVKDHKDHDFEFNQVAATKKRKELMESLKPLREVAASLSVAMEEIRTTECELVAQGKSVANKIETSYEELHRIVESSKQQMLEEAAGKCNEKMENLQRQKKNTSLSGAEVQGIVDYTEQCVKHCSDDEVMCIHAEIGSRIMQEIEKHDELGSNCFPVEEVDIGVEVRCADSLEQLLQTQANIIQLPVTLIIDRIASKAEVNKLSEVNIYTTKLCNNKPTKRAVQVDCHLKCLHSGSLVKRSIEEIGANHHRIQFIPTIRGRHKVTVSVDGLQVAGSPIPVFVSISPTQLGEPVKVWGGIVMPSGITVNSVGEIMVTELEGDLVVLDRVGRKVRGINRTEHQLQLSQGISVDSEDNIYFTDLDTNRIFKSNKNCSKVQVHRVQQVKGPGHINVAVVGDEVMVTECYNEGRIMVYDRQLNYVRQIVGADEKTLCYLSTDSHHNVYTSVPGNLSIQVFKNSGEFLRSICCDENGLNRLKCPYGVCVAGQYVYVGDVGVEKIVVFTTEGDYVTSFGSRYHDIMCVDRDGFVYACFCGCLEINIY